VHESYLWVEGLITSFPQLGPWQTAVKNGLLEVGVTPDNGDSLEHVYGTKIGGSLFDRNGHRHTAANLLEYADPNNLRVLLFATAHRVLMHTGNVFSTERLYEFQENSSLVLRVMGSMSCSCF
jgi:choline dehydrogenase